MNGKDSNSIFSQRFTPGQVLNINNPNPYSVRYRVVFGDNSSIQFTVNPGASFTITAGNSGDININIEEAIPATGPQPL